MTQPTPISGNTGADEDLLVENDAEFNFNADADAAELAETEIERGRVRRARAYASDHRTLLGVIIGAAVVLSTIGALTIMAIARFGGDED